MARLRVRAWRLAAILVAIAVALGLVGFYVHSSADKPQPAGATSSAVTTTVDATGGQVSFPGGRLTVPAGAVRGPTTLRVDTGRKPTLPASPLARLLHPLGTGVTINLSGAQPLVPLQLTLTVAPAALPATAAPEAVSVATIPSGSGQLHLLPADYDPQQRLVSVEVPHLSWFAPVLLKAESLLGQFVDHFQGSLGQWLELRAARPGCAASRSAALPDGSIRVVGYDTLARTSLDGWDDPPIWACVETTGDGNVVLELTNNRAVGFSFAPPAGATVEPPTTDPLRIGSLEESFSRFLYNVAYAGTVNNRQVLAGTATMRVRLPESRLDASLRRLPGHESERHGQELDLFADPGLFFAAALQFGLIEFAGRIIGLDQDSPKVVERALHAVFDETNLRCMWTATSDLGRVAEKAVGDVRQAFLAARKALWTAQPPCGMPRWRCSSAPNRDRPGPGYPRASLARRACSAPPPPSSGS